MIFLLQPVNDSLDPLDAVANAVGERIGFQGQLVAGHGPVEQLHYPERVADLRGAANESNQVVFEEVKFIEKDDVATILVFQPRQIQRLLPVKKAVERFLKRDSHQPDLRAPLE